ncbi:hypothetical protein BS47DRAFT_1327699 [Hydnum rufescens UP504]|uniref:Yeast cell wall synthesis Kre9/Knh1-like N-terminal domain-containing protein n=1 Tax=Hydnum rufescens UP504 TaxID=1448309 RepID=A0A9P6B1K5_9AGAM|nr:hypothetical protein BS47DRAFT_1327699 [Hydnum rufescens UP504]
MRSAFFASTLLAFLVPQTFAVIYITEPTASTVCSAGVPCNVRWNDDGQAPVLATIGACSVGLYVGSQQQQTFLQDISDNTLVANQSFVQWTPNASVGPNNSNYFVRFASLSYKDPNNPQYPYMSFSAKFTLNGMTGTFNSTVLSQISAAPSSTSASVSSTSAAATTTLSKATTSKATGSSTSTASSSAASSTQTSRC